MSDDDQTAVSHPGQPQVPAPQWAAQSGSPVAGPIYEESSYSSGDRPSSNQALSISPSSQARQTRASQQKRPFFRFVIIIVLGAIMTGCAMLILERLLWSDYPYSPYPTYAPITFLATIPAAWWILRRDLHALLILTGTALILGLFLADGSQIMYDLGSSNDYAPIPISIIVIFALVLLWQSMNKQGVRPIFLTRKKPRNVTVNSLEGEVKGFQERAEEKRTADKDVKITVWSFRLERYSADGTRLAPTPVQMRGEAFTGFINEGDTVRLNGKWRDGQLFQTDRVFNVTNNVEVRATQASMTLGKGFMYVIGLLIWLLLFAFLLGLIFTT